MIQTHDQEEALKIDGQSKGTHPSSVDHPKDSSTRIHIPTCNFHMICMVQFLIYPSEEKRLNFPWQKSSLWVVWNLSTKKAWQLSKIGSINGWQANPTKNQRHINKAPPGHLFLFSTHPLFLYTGVNYHLFIESHYHPEPIRFQSFLTVGWEIACLIILSHRRMRD